VSDLTSAAATVPDERPRRRSVVAAIHCMVLAGGLAALSWEVVWQLQATLAFGVSAIGTALTLAVTMGGMTLGSLAMGQKLRGRTVARPLRLYGWLELVIGACGLMMLPGFRALEVVDTAVYAVAPGLAPLLQAFGMFALLAPATLAMGATVPVFQLVAGRHRTWVAALYGMNTAGAAVGVLLLSFVLLPRLGVTWSCLIVAGVNAAVFVLAFVFDRDGAAAPANAPTVAPAPARALRLAPQLVVFCTGFVTFGLEVSWFRALRAAFWSTSSTFAILLAAVLIPLAVGARIVPWLRRRGVTPAPLLLCAGAAILLGTPGVERLDLLRAMPLEPARTLVVWLLASLLTIGPAVLFLATALPLYLEDHPDPGATGRLYGLNTLGSMAGSLVAAWVFLPWVGSSRTSWLLGLVVVCAAAALMGRRGRLVAAGVGAAALLVAFVFTSSPGRDRIHGVPEGHGEKVIAVDEGPDFTASVIDWKDGARYLYIDGFSATSTAAISGHYMYWMGALPARLHPAPERALVICFGTGQTANGLRHHVSGRIDVVEISPAVLDLAHYFEVNEGVLDDPRIEPIVMDGRAWLRRTDTRYDVITLEPMPPNFAGVNSLYSKQFYEIAASRLNDGGIVAQWLPIHLVDPWDAASITATFRAVFPDTILWLDPVIQTAILVGRHGSADEPFGTVHPTTGQDPPDRYLTDEQIRRSMTLSGAPLADYATRGRIITDDNQLLQYSQFRGRITHRDTNASQRLNETILERISGRPLYRIRR